MSPAVRFQNVSRRFGSVRAVDGVSLDIEPGEFFALLGPSGSGKTTCLRLIAGFEQPDEGHIEIFGETAEGVPPYRRNVNTVFQDYALFPHMTVGENVAYGLMIKGIGKAEREEKAKNALAMVKLAGYEVRRTAQLSGGQRQRVALARALVNGPKVLLLDEPLGALDLKLREQMQEELKTLQTGLGITFVFVTHDQGEALSMANRVAIFNEGKIVQIGTPSDVYERPSSRFVADFVGSSNVLSPEFAASHGGRAAWTSLRPEKIQVAALSALVPAACASATGPVTAISYQGAVTRITVATDKVALVATAPAGTSLRKGDNVKLIWPKSAMMAMGDGA
jgi:putative spermidine/putrescine transport system ATP-binding protein